MGIPHREKQSRTYLFINPNNAARFLQGRFCTYISKERKESRDEYWSI